MTIKDGFISSEIDPVNHTFILPKGSPIPPHERDLYLETRSFKVTWKIDCLAPMSCPTLHPVDQAISCSAPAAPVNDVCEWRCSGEIRFPVKMQLTIDEASINDSFQKQEWQSVVSYPGQQLT